MKTLSANAYEHLRRDCTSLALCWEIEKRDGSFLRGTDHDVPIILTSGDRAGYYSAGANISGANRKSTSDGSIDNTEVLGAVESSTTLGVNVVDIESGNLSGAAVLLFCCDWQNPDAWQLVLQAGHLGEIVRDSDGQYTTELRGLKQLLSQVFVRTFSTRCQVKRFGDSECGLDLASRTYTGTVTAVTNRKRFNSTISTGSPAAAAGDFRGAECTMTSGQNIGTMREVKRDDNDSTLGNLSFWDAFPYDVQVGDTFTIVEGCDRLWSTCKRKGNQLNFRGWGLLIPGNDVLMRGPT